MSVDGVGAAAAGNADLAALVDAELAQLAADAQALGALLVEDAVVTARVLPSNGLTDLIEIAGRRVAASLPPTVRPGDVLQVQVTGFDGDRIMLQIVGTEAGGAIETGPPPAPGAPPGAAFVPSTTQPPAIAPPPSAVPPGTAAIGASAVPPSAARPATPAPTTVGSGITAVPSVRTGPGPAFSAVVTRANVGAAPAASSGTGAEHAARAADAGGDADGDAVRTTPSAGAPRAAGIAARASASGPMPGTTRPIAPPAPATAIEARLAAARASIAPPPSSAGTHAPSGTPAGASRFVAPPPIASKAITPPLPRPASAATYAEPVALLRALRLPVTPSNVASATLALQRPAALPGALAALESALPRASGDPNVATLRTLLAFVGRIDPSSPVLAAQVEAYVGHVVDGAEPKIATLLAAHAAAAPDGTAAPHALAPAVAAERAAALSVDLKQTLLAVAADPATPATVAPALAGAITALTAAQVSASQMLAANPNGVAFTIPLSTAQGQTSAQITVTRDARERGGARADASNFRIAFVLETMHHGTVAIDLVTVGRDVTVEVRTESAPAMRAFRDALGGLTERLESLRYHVAAAGASVGTTSTVAVEAPPVAAPDPDAVVDRSA